MGSKDDLCKNVVEKFRNWFTKELTVTEQRDLYDVMAMIRGPDRIEDRTWKMFLTGRVRHLLGIIERPGDMQEYARSFIPLSNDEPFLTFEEMIEETEKIPTGHYHDHAIGMLRRLEILGIIRKAEVK